MKENKAPAELEKAKPAPVSQEQLWDWFPRIQKIAWKLGKGDNYGTQEDLARDALLRMSDKRHLINSPHQLFTIVRNFKITQHRKWDRQVPTDQALIEIETSDIAQERVLCQEVVDAIAKLTPEHQAVIRLAAEELTVKEMGEVLGICPGTAKSRLSRARVALKKRLAIEGLVIE